MWFSHLLNPRPHHLRQHLICHDPLGAFGPPKARQRLLLLLLLHEFWVRVRFVDVPYSSAYNLHVIVVIDDLDPMACGVVDVVFILAGCTCLDGFFAGGGVGAEDGAEEGEDGVIGRGMGEPFAVHGRREFA